MGGSEERFQTTNWSEIQNAKTLNETRRKELVNELLSKYWKPVYCYLRRKGYGNEHAKDLTQGFMCEVALGRELIQRADQAKGKFRTFLLTALVRYTTDEYHKETSQKRSPKEQFMPLESSELQDILKAQSELEPDQIFHYAWASEVLSQVLADVRNYCYSRDKKNHWDVFREKVILPIMENNETPALKELCVKYGIKDEARVSNMIAFVKDRFRATMKRHLRQFVQSESQVEEEFIDIFRILTKN